MKPGFAILIPLFLLAALSGCQERKSPSTVVTWNRGEELPQVFLSPQFKKDERSVWVHGEVVRFSRQYWGPAEVEGGSVQMIETSRGDAVYGRAQFVTPPEDEDQLSPALLERLDQNKYFFFETLRKKSRKFRHAKMVSDPKLMILQAKRPTPVYAVDLLNETKGAVERFFIAPDFTVLKTETVSSDFETPAWVFTVTNQQTLQEILLSAIAEKEALLAPSLRVISASPFSVSNHEAPWKFEIEDPRFEQVQAFYFLQKGLNFFANELQFRLPVTVEVSTSYGYPNKTNAAFTYHNQIRLGSGDGQIYSSFARDPSIVVHELGHVVIEMLAHLPTQGEGGSINEAFADFFAASHLDSPLMGSVSYIPAPFRRNLTDLVTYEQRNKGLYHDSLIVSGTLWELRGRLGTAVTQRLALRCLARLGPAQSLVDFPKALLKAAETVLSPDERKIVLEVLEARKWPQSSLL